MKRLPFTLLLFVLISSAMVRPTFAVEPMVFGGTLSNIYLKEDGTVWTWGDNTYGQLGDGTRTMSVSPKQVEGLSNIISVAIYTHAVALKSDGTIWTWGANLWGQLGNEKSGAGEYTNRPHKVEGIDNVSKINIGNGFSIAIKKDGTIWLWGKNDRGQLGTGNTIAQVHPVEILGMKGALDIQGGDGFSLALKDDGIIRSWGRNNEGELGNGTLKDNIYPAAVEKIKGIMTIYSGGGHSMALSNDKQVFAWGKNYHGELGDGTLVNAKLPVRVQNLPDNIVSIACDQGHSFALTDTGQIWGWGANKYGELGNGTQEDTKLPTKIVSLTDVIQIDTGTYHGIALRKDGTLWTWGANVYGQLGNGNTNSSATPIPVVFPP